MIETTTTIIIYVETVTTSTTVTAADLSNLSGIDVAMLNTYTYLGSAFILGFFFFFVCKGIYKFFNMFF